MQTETKYYVLIITTVCPTKVSPRAKEKLTDIIICNALLLLLKISTITQYDLVSWSSEDETVTEILFFSKKE